MATVTCLLVPLAILFYRARYFHALFYAFGQACSSLRTVAPFPNMLLAALPIVGAGAIGASGYIRGGLLASMSLVSYSLALMTPALEIRSDLLLGIQAFIFSFMLTAMGADFFASEGPSWEGIACAVGMVANISFIAGSVSFITQAVTNKGLSLSRKFARFGSCLAFLVIIPLVLSAELETIYIGYGLWAASFLLLAFGTGSVKTKKNVAH